MDDQRDTPTEKVDSGKGQPPETSTQQRVTPTEKVNQGQQWQPYPAPQAEPSAPAAKTEILDRKRQLPTFAWLVIVAGPHTGEIHRLSAEATSIGRDSSNTLRLGDEFVSRQHAKVRTEEDDEGNQHFYLYDLASNAGVFVNGERVYRHRLTNGDRLRLGQTELIFKQPARLLMDDLETAES